MYLLICEFNLLINYFLCFVKHILNIQKHPLNLSLVSYSLFFLIIYQTPPLVSGIFLYLYPPLVSGPPHTVLSLCSAPPPHSRFLCISGGLLGPRLFYHVLSTISDFQVETKTPQTGQLMARPLVPASTCQHSIQHK